jgi:PKD repeat protein
MHPASTRFAAVVVAAVTSVSCTMKNQEAPPLTGPSEFGTSIGVAVTPDVLQLDGASQSVIVVTVRDAGSQPLRNVPLRADITLGGQVVDFGSLSSKSLVTNGDGRATVVYTAPASAGESEAVIDIEITPIGSNYQNAMPRTASIRLVPTGIRVPPSDLTPAFTFSPDAPIEKQNVLFDASASTGSIAQYKWDFGNGSTGSGETTTHAFGGPGTYFVRLTLVDGLGRSASTTRSVTVGQGALPTASFTFSPTDPVVGDVVNFNGTQSTAATGRRIVGWAWNFGNGESASGPLATVKYTTARTYTITLTVTDDIGRTNTSSRTLQVK